MDLSEPLDSETLLVLAPVVGGTSDTSSLIRAMAADGDALSAGASLLVSVPAGGIEIFDTRHRQLVWRERGP